MRKELVMYSRSTGCPSVRVARRILEDQNVPYREIFIDEDPQAGARLQVWTGFLSVPTLVVTRPGEDVPIDEPEAIAQGHSPRGINRGSMISEPNAGQLTTWLQQHGLIEARAAG